MRILVTGLDQSNFITQLYSGIKQQKKSLYVAVTGLRLHGNQNKENSGDDAFDKVYNLSKIKHAHLPAAVLTLVFSKWFYQLLIYILFVEGKVKKAAHFCICAVKEKAFYYSNNSFKSFDVFHFHYMQYSYLRGVWMVPAGKKIICSFWGSDLLRTADNFNHFVVAKALQRANVITVQSVELREIVLAKYGRELKGKIRLAQFALSQDTFSAIDEVRGNKALANGFCLANNIVYNKQKIVIGHNASDYNNHIQVIEALAQVKSKDKLFVIVPFAYGIAQNERQTYRLSIESALKKAALPGVILDNYLTGQQLALLRSITDILIHMPESDALSAALTETAYAGGLILTGSWLPYSPFKNAGMQLWYASAFADVAAQIQKMLDAFDEYKLIASAKNRQAVANHFFTTATTKGWITILDELYPGK
jgi:hypothetical protein